VPLSLSHDHLVKKKLSDSPHDEHWSCGPRPIRLFRTSKFLSFYLDIKINSRI
jgi:hypothetical protein